MNTTYVGGQEWCKNSYFTGKARHNKYYSQKYKSDTYCKFTIVSAETLTKQSVATNLKQ